MRVRMKVSIVGPRDGQDWPPRGDEITVSDTEGADLCANGYAEPVVEDQPQVEKRPTPATNVRPRQSPKKGAKG